MKLNHLVPRADANQKCNKTDPNSKQHFWALSGRIETTISNMISIDFICKYCNKRTTNFLTVDEYKLNQKLLEDTNVFISTK